MKKHRKFVIRIGRQYLIQTDAGHRYGIRECAAWVWKRDVGAAHDFVKKWHPDCDVDIEPLYP